MFMEYLNPDEVYTSLLHMYCIVTGFYTLVLLPEFGGRMSKHVGETTVLLYTYIQGVLGGNINIL
jgi:hypothetical protein